MGIGINLEDYNKGELVVKSTYITQTFKLYSFRELETLQRKAKKICAYLVSKTYFKYDGITQSYRSIGNKVKYIDFIVFGRMIQREKESLGLGKRKISYNNPYIFSGLLDKRFEWEVIPAMEMIETLQKRLETCEKRAQASRRKLNAELAEIEDFTRRWKNEGDEVDNQRENLL